MTPGDKLKRFFTSAVLVYFLIMLLTFFGSFIATLLNNAQVAHELAVIFVVMFIIFFVGAFISSFLQPKSKESRSESHD